MPGNRRGVSKSRDETPSRRDAPQAGDTNSAQQHALVQQMELESFSGPLPPPQVLQEYENILPGLADRIVRMTEIQSAHRQDLERYITRSDSRRANAGLICAVLIAVMGLVGSYLLITGGYSFEGTGLGGATLVGLVVAFIYGTNSRKQERIQRARILTGQDATGDLPAKSRTQRR